MSLTKFKGSLAYYLFKILQSIQQSRYKIQHDDSVEKEIYEVLTIPSSYNEMCFFSWLVPKRPD